MDGQENREGAPAYCFGVLTTARLFIFMVVVPPL
jgi:hypothetical protein